MLYPRSLQLQQLLVLRVGVECSACLFLGEDICLYELVKLLKDCVFCSVQDYRLQKLLQKSILELGAERV